MQHNFFSSFFSASSIQLHPGESSVCSKLMLLFIHDPVLRYHFFLSIDWEEKKSSGKSTIAQFVSTYELQHRYETLEVLRQPNETEYTFSIWKKSYINIGNNVCNIGIHCASLSFIRCFRFVSFLYQYPMQRE